MTMETILTTFFEEETEETFHAPSLVLEEYVPPPAPEHPPVPHRTETAYDTRFFDPVGGSIPAKEPLMVLRASDPLSVHIVEQYAQAATGENRERAKVIARSMRQWQQARKSRNAQVE
jgi:hypothetical protein